MDSKLLLINFKILKKICDNDEVLYPISRYTYSKKLNILQILILNSNDILINDFLKNNIQFFKKKSIIKMIKDVQH